MRNLVRSTLVASIVVLVQGLAPLTVADAATQHQDAASSTTGWWCRLTHLC